MQSFPPSPCCGAPVVLGDEISTGWNGALSDVGTGRLIPFCDDCGKYVEEYDSAADDDGFYWEEDY